MNRCFYLTKGLGYDLKKRKDLIDRIIDREVCKLYSKDELYLLMLNKPLVDRVIEGSDFPDCYFYDKDKGFHIHDFFNYCEGNIYKLNASENEYLTSLKDYSYQTWSYIMVRDKLNDPNEMLTEPLETLDVLLETLKKDISQINSVIPSKVRVLVEGHLNNGDLLNQDLNPEFEGLNVIDKQFQIYMKNHDIKVHITPTGTVVTYVILK